MIVLKAVALHPLLSTTLYITWCAPAPANAPARFIEQAAPALEAYAQSSALRLEAQVKQAQNTPLRIEGGKVAATAADQVAWLRSNGFTEVLSRTAVQLANEEEGQMGSLWDAVQGVTAAARGMKHTDERFEVEQKAGALLSKYAVATA